MLLNKPCIRAAIASSPRAPRLAQRCRSATSQRLALHFIHQFAVNSTCVCAVRRVCWPPGCKACGEFDDGVRCLPRPAAAAVSRAGCLALAVAAVAAAAARRLPPSRCGQRAARADHGSSRPGQLLKLPEKTATLVIGNPLIADAAVQPGGVVVITAKSYGMTNLVALDRTGATLRSIRSRWSARATNRRGAIAASSARPIAARRIASGASRSATREPTSRTTCSALSAFNAQAAGGAEADSRLRRRRG